MTYECTTMERDDQTDFERRQRRKEGVKMLLRDGDMLDAVVSNMLFSAVKAGCREPYKLTEFAELSIEVLDEMATNGTGEEFLNYVRRTARDSGLSVGEVDWIKNAVEEFRRAQQDMH